MSRRTLVADITKTSLTSRSGPPCLQGPSARYLINFYSILELTVRALVRQPPTSGRYTRRLRPTVDGQRINLFRALAIGERVGNAGSDLFRSPMKRLFPCAASGSTQLNFRLAAFDCAM